MFSWRSMFSIIIALSPFFLAESRPAPGDVSRPEEVRQGHVISKIADAGTRVNGVVYTFFGSFECPGKTG